MAVKQGESVVSLLSSIQDILDLLRFRGTVLNWNVGWAAIEKERI